MEVGGIQNSLSKKVSAFGYFDARDLNRDGFVSPSEFTTYSLRHPELKPSNRSNLASNNTPNRFASENTSMQQYNKQGAFRQQTSSTSRYLDMYA
ncbi:MAG: hypothetical protein Q8O00_11385 [Holophaga sp.]|nr:hypothetical protein [Holophaga sp.]